MRIYETLQPNQRTEFNVQGQFVYLHTASAPIQVQIDGALPITLAQYDQIKSDSMKTLVVENTSNQLNPVVIEIGYGSFSPSNSGHQVVVGNWPAIQQVTQYEPVKIANWPSSQTVSIANWKSVQAVKQSGDFVVSVSNDNSDHLSTVITLANGAGTLEKNTQRSKVILKADASNSADVLLDDYPLSKGEVITLSSTGALSFTGTDGDKIYCLEDVSA
ncbi:hypothetical protein [Celerinatantimonas sp. MCCC 1A17872]|uniref:hypothetical protein n=1 Tax=Celerinatantimonas sp. MCCC 1A17872 TaxID=3177514 RepID=UPI0038C09382